MVARYVESNRGKPGLTVRTALKSRFGTVCPQQRFLDDVVRQGIVANEAAMRVSCPVGSTETTHCEKPLSWL